MQNLADLCRFEQICDQFGTFYADLCIYAHLSTFEQICADFREAAGTGRRGWCMWVVAVTVLTQRARRK